MEEVTVLNYCEKRASRRSGTRTWHNRGPFTTCFLCKHSPSSVYRGPIVFGKRLISKAYGCNIWLFPVIDIFGAFLIPYDSDLSARLQKVISFSFLLAWRSILFNWKDAETSTLTSSWEKKTVSIERFYRSWAPLINYVNSLSDSELRTFISSTVRSGLFFVFWLFSTWFRWCFIVLWDKFLFFIYEHMKNIYK